MTYNADVSLLFSEIDPVQNNAVSTAVNTAGFSETMVWSGQPGGCGNPSFRHLHTMLSAGGELHAASITSSTALRFDKSNASSSLFPAGTSLGTHWNRIGAPGECWPADARSVDRWRANGNARSLGFGLIAEDGNPLPGVRRVQSEVFMAAGKTYDVMIERTCRGRDGPPDFRPCRRACRATRPSAMPACWLTSASMAQGCRRGSWTRRGARSQSGYL